MPIISRFYGITIRMYYKDHSPPHFHAQYGGHELEVGITPIQILQGDAPKRAASLVLDWALMHQQELRDNWDRCRRGQPPQPINPLD